MVFLPFKFSKHQKIVDIFLLFNLWIFVFFANIQFQTALISTKGLI